MTGSGDLLGLLITGLLCVSLVIAAAAEAAAIVISRLRVRLLIKQGLPRSRALDRFAQERTAVLSSLVLFRNVALTGATSGGLYLYLRHVDGGWFGVLVFAAIAVAVVTMLQAVPRMIVSRQPEHWSLRLGPFIKPVGTLLGPLASLFDWPARLALRLTGQTPNGESDEVEELVRILEMEQGAGAIEEEERDMIRGIIDLVDTTAREIMVPRVDIVALPDQSTIDQAVSVIVERGFSRLPVFHESIDRVVGVLYAKDMLPYLLSGERPALREITRPPYVIPEGKKVDELLTELRQNKIHIALVVDEYGGTAGLITIEDLLEEIVGEIEDEYDVADTSIEQLGENEAIVDARLTIEALNELFSVNIDDEEFDTVGGLVYHRLGKMPGPGDSLSVDGLNLSVLSVMDRRIKKVLVSRQLTEPVAASTR
ncbi:MAG: DUF21 domain-containing protein [Dehalococcoidia bacterium]|nr:DUF21 domain-containing protein [Dehalococcoidia bacterium]